MYKAVEGFPVSPQQEHIWSIQRYDHAGSAYRSQCMVLIDGQVDAESLMSALRTVVDRHEILRTTFQSLPGSPIVLQVIQNGPSVALEEYQLTEKGTDQQEEELDYLFREMASEPVDFESGPLLRSGLAHLSAQRSALLLATPAVCCDARSLNNLVGELSRAYRKHSEPDGDQQEPMQYADFAQWQSEVLASGEVEAGISYWRGQAGHGQMRLDLPFRKTREAVPFKPASLSFKTSPDVSEAVKRTVLANGTTTQVLLFSVWIVLVSRLTGRQDIVIGLGCEGRNYPELIGAMGPFKRYLPLRHSLAAVRRVGDLITQVEQSARDASMWQDAFSWETTLDVTASDRGQLFCPVSFDFASEDKPHNSPSIRFRTTRRYECIDRYEVKLAVIEEEDGLISELHYDSNLYERHDIAWIPGRLESMVKSMADHFDSALADLDILGAEERHQLQVEFNRTESGYDCERMVHEMFDRQASVRPDTIAAVHEGQHLTYGELNRRANHLGHLLRRYGVEPEAKVAICLDRGLNQFVGLLAVLKAGAAYLPLDRAFPPQRLEYMIEDSRASVVLVEQGYAEAIPNRFNTICMNGDWDRMGLEADTAPVAHVDSRNLVYVIYTSGSTGRPKAIGVEHRQLSNYSQAIVKRLGAAAGASYAAFSTVAADLGNTAIFTCLISGGCLHIISQERLFDAAALQEYFSANYVDYLKVVPSHMEALQGPTESGLMPRTALILGGEASSTTWVARLQERSPDCAIINHYGPTETTVGALTYCLGSTDLANGRLTVPVGRPLGNMAAYVLDDTVDIVPMGIAGEIYIGGNGVARGYMGQPDLTAERFVANRLGPPGSRLYRTGDLGRYGQTGDIEFVGRKDHQVKIRGFRIELGEIETILEQEPAVRKCVVTVGEDPSGRKRLIAYVQPQTQAPSERQLEAFAARALPEYMIPSVWVFLNSLPLTSNGKVDRASLPPPRAEAAEQIDSFVAARTEAERSLAEIWSSVLGIERVGIHDNFFKLGGDSILSIQLVSRAMSAGYKLSARDIFQHQTLAELAAVAATPGASTAEQGVLTGDVPLTPIQRRFFDRTTTDPFHRNQCVVLKVTKETLVPVLEAALRCISFHHDALRLRIVQSGADWLQSYSGVEQPSVLQMDLSALTESDQTSAFECAATQLHASLSLSSGPMMRAALFNLRNEDQARLLILIHHLVVDGVSWRILLEDLQNACESVRVGARVELPQKTTSYRQWAVQLSEHAASREVLSELDYWLGELGPPVKPFPVDYNPGRTCEASSRTIDTWLDGERTSVLIRGVSKEAESGIQSVLLAALGLAIRRWCGAETLLVDLESHGRQEIFPELDLSRTVGWFTAVFPVRFAVGGSTPDEVLRTVREHLREVPNRGIGYGIVRYLSPDGVGERLRDLPEPEISFNYLGQLDRVIMTDSPFSLVTGHTGKTRSPRHKRDHLIEINGSVIGGRLRLEWTYSSDVHRAETIEGLAAEFLSSLTGLLDHSAHLETRIGRLSRYNVLTAAARPHLGEVSAAIEHSGTIEDAYPLSPMQEGLLFHCLYEQGSGSYITQATCMLTGLDVEDFKTAWQQVIDRHPILRTAIAWKNLNEPLQVVATPVEAPLLEQDWSRVSENDQRERLENYLESDRSDGFDVSRPPLMRLRLFGLGRQRYYFVWSRHHILLDGWSTNLIIKELISIYEGLRRNETVRPEPVKPYRDYIAWLSSQDLNGSEHYWRTALRGLVRPASLKPKSGYAESPDGISSALQRFADHRLRPPAESLVLLESLTRQHALTMNTLVQGAWAMLLSRYSFQREVVFGTVISGRSPQLSGIESMVGLFINTLPVRVNVPPDETVISWLKQLQDQQAQLREYGYSPLSEIHRWSDVPAGVPLFESIIAFENYPVDDAVSRLRASFQIDDFRVIERNSYPLAVVIGGDPASWGKMVYDESYFEAGYLEQISDHFQSLLLSMAAKPFALTGELEMLSQAEKLLVHQPTRVDELDSGFSF
jgi:amino acid adenylation domain-containing protein/non-ribosomal peptide synthase protein (TIGR01720 family)